MKCRGPLWTMTFQSFSKSNLGRFGIYSRVFRLTGPVMRESLFSSEKPKGYLSMPQQFVVLSNVTSNGRLKTYLSFLLDAKLRVIHERERGKLLVNRHSENLTRFTIKF